jgi:hypothetical protein
MPAVAEKIQQNVNTHIEQGESQNCFSTIEELSRLLEEGMDDIRNGLVYTEAEMDEALDLM